MNKPVYRRRAEEAIPSAFCPCRARSHLTKSLHNGKFCFPIIEGVDQHRADELDTQMTPLSTVKRSRRTREPQIFGVLTVIRTIVGALIQFGFSNSKHAGGSVMGDLLKVVSRKRSQRQLHRIRVGLAEAWIFLPCYLGLLRFAVVTSK